MDCDFCEADIEDRGLLITAGVPEKQWACSDCFITALIKGRADIVHHWGYETEEPEEETEPTEE